MLNVNDYARIIPEPTHAPVRILRIFKSNFGGMIDDYAEVTSGAGFTFSTRLANLAPLTEEK